MLEFLKSRIEKRLERVMERRLSMSALDVAIDLVVGNQVEGDYLEFGVYSGHSFALAYERFRTYERRHNASPQRRFFAFDSFEGLPASNDELRPAQYGAGAYAAGEADFVHYLKKSGVDRSRVKIIRKWFSALTPADKTDLGLERAAVVYLDCDVYESTKAALDFTADLLVDGSVIVLDDFFRHRSSRHHGVRRAWEEFLSGNERFEPTMVHLHRRIAFAINLRHEAEA